MLGAVCTVGYFIDICNSANCTCLSVPVESSCIELCYFPSYSDKFGIKIRS